MKCYSRRLMRRVMRKIKAVRPPDLFIRYLQAEFPTTDVVAELRFHPSRMWRFDYAFPEYKVAVEVDGGVWQGGRHNLPQGYVKDMEKLNTAASMGWIVLRITPQQRFTTATVDFIKEAMKSSKSTEITRNK